MRRFFGLALLALVSGCPSAVEHHYGQASPEPTPEVTDDDPRVVRDGEDLYPAAVVQRARELERPESGQGLGSGKPDESNGECRLYAPELPAPECCKSEYGFDAKATQEACGHDLYLGESFQYSCGYFFHHAESGTPTWIRISMVPYRSTKEAADSHDIRMRNKKIEGFASEPVPGVPGAYWSRHEDLRWAFIPGWSRVREVAWHETACSDEGMLKVLAQLAAAKEPPPGAPRLGLIPTARK